MEGGGRGGEMVVVPPGLRFYPTEEELVSFYLKNKINGSATQNIDHVIPQLNVYDFNPWDLSQYAGELCHGDPEQWFFFVPRQEKEARGGRPCRLTSSGYWKATGSTSVVYSSGNRGIGMKRTMVFYSGKAPTGKKTKWKMNEYKVFQGDASAKTSPNPKLMQEFSLCRVYVKSKCLRAFDRRPSGVAIRQTRHNENHRAVTSHFNHLSIIESTTNSTDHSSNSSEFHATNVSPSIMEIDNQPLWDWVEHLNWF